MKIVNNLIKYGFCLIICFIGYVDGLEAQIIQRNLFVNVDDVDEADVEDVMLNVETAFVKYKSYASLRGSSGTVDQEGVNNFSQLFNINANISNDVEILNYGQETTVYEYTNLVYQNLQESGVEFTLESPTFSALTYDLAGFFIMEVKVRKIVFNALDGNLRQDECSKGRVFSQVMTFEVSEEDMEDVEITKITSVMTQDCDDANMSVSVGGRYGIGSDISYDGLLNHALNFSPTLINDPNLDVNVTFVSQISFGGMLNLYPLENSKMGFHVGVQYESTSFDLEIDNSYEVADVDGTSTPYTRGVIFDNINVDRTVADNQVSTRDAQLKYENAGGLVDAYAYTAIAFPIGISFQYDFSPNFSLAPMIQIIPTLGLSSTSTLTGQVSYVGTYNYETVQPGTNGEVKFISNHLESSDEFGFTEDNSINKDLESEGAFHLNASGGLHFRLSVSDKVQVYFGPDYRIGLNSILTHQTRDNRLLQDGVDDIGNSIAADYLEELKITSIGGNIGVTVQLK